MRFVNLPSSREYSLGLCQDTLRAALAAIALDALRRPRVAKVHDGSVVRDGDFCQGVPRPFNTSKTFGFTTLMGLPAA